MVGRARELGCSSSAGAGQSKVVPEGLGWVDCGSCVGLGVEVWNRSSCTARSESELPCGGLHYSSLQELTKPRAEHARRRAGGKGRVRRGWCWMRACRRRTDAAQAQRRREPAAFAEWSRSRERQAGVMHRWTAMCKRGTTLLVSCFQQRVGQQISGPRPAELPVLLPPARPGRGPGQRQLGRVRQSSRAPCPPTTKPSARARLKNQPRCGCCCPSTAAAAVPAPVCLAASPAASHKAHVVAAGCRTRVATARASAVLLPSSSVRSFPGRTHLLQQTGATRTDAAVRQPPQPTRVSRDAAPSIASGAPEPLACPA